MHLKVDVRNIYFFMSMHTWGTWLVKMYHVTERNFIKSLHVTKKEQEWFQTLHWTMKKTTKFYVHHRIIVCNNKPAEVTLCAPRLISWLYRHTSDLFILRFLWVYCLRWVRLGWQSVCVIHCLWFIGSLLSAHQSTPQGSYNNFIYFLRGYIQDNLVVATTEKCSPAAYKKKKKSFGNK